MPSTSRTTTSRRPPSAAGADAAHPRRAIGAVKRRLEDAVGGPARTKVVVLFACVLALENADLTAVGAAGPQLRSGLGISNTQLGLLAAISTFIGALATLPFGALADRVRRVWLLAGAVAMWSAAMALSAAAQSYGWLLLSRLGLGVLIAAALPAIASLTGDFFPADERGKIYGYILSGELLGAGFGFVVSGSLAGALSWRWAFVAPIVPALVLAAVIWRGLPEPARGGASRLEPGAERIVGAEEAAQAPGRTANDEPPAAAHAARGPQNDEVGVAREAVARSDVEPLERQVLREDPARMSLPRATRYVLTVRSNRWLIVAGAIGYFFFAGLRTFALVFMRGQFGLAQSAATAALFAAGIGSLIGVLIAGRLADRLIRGGRLDARVLVGAICYLAAPVLLAPALLVSSLAVAFPLLFLAAASLSSPNPPLDAARLDVMPAPLWGRAEGVRTMFRQCAQAVAPLVFGIVADLLGGSGGAFGSGGQVSPATTQGVQAAFLIMLVPLALSGVALLVARRSYPSDVATAIESERRLSRDPEPG